MYTRFGTTINGLPAAEIPGRLEKYGHNSVVQEKFRPVIIEFLLNFRNPLILILLCIVAVSLFLGETIDALIVLGMVIMSAVLNFYQEHQANIAARKLKNTVAHTSCVLRDGIADEIPAVNIVPGDVLKLNAGDMIPADARIVQAKDLYINQSVLTGESFPVAKSGGAMDISQPDISLFTNMAFAGTSVISGSATAVVILTGVRTEFGKVAEKIAAAGETNEFTKGVGDFSVMILRIILLFVLFIFLVNAFIKQDVLQALTFSIAVAVGLTPEFLPMILSVTMSKGSQNMAKKGVIVKRLTAIPTFGSMEILATDKTGTLTEDRITLVKYLDYDGGDSEDVFLSAYLNSSFQTGITNPMDEAVMKFKSADISAYRKIDEIPFDFDRKRMSVIVEKEGSQILITKGAPEEVISVCSRVEESGSGRELDTQHRQNLENAFSALSSDGFRVLAVAQKVITDKKAVYSKSDESGMTFVGLAAFMDPAKSGVKESIDELEEMGIEVKVITGDNELVTRKICSTAGIEIKGMLLGHESDSMNDEQLYRKSLETTVFTRFSPGQKERVIKVLKDRGKVIGYMGDGINDAPSLKAADVGISVSNGVDVAKESSDIILTRKSLHELKNGVIEGRKTFGNTMKYILMGLSSNFGNMFSVLGAVIFLPFLPMLPIQILLNNFLYDVSQVAIPTDNVDQDFIRRPRRWNMIHIRNFMFIFGPISSVFDFLTFFVLFLFFRQMPGSFQTGWFLESLATQTLVIHIIRTRKLPFIQSTAGKFLSISTAAVVAVGWIIPFTGFGKYFGFTPLPPAVMLLLAGIVGLYLVTAELGKRVYYRKFFA
ncbi:magnesium-translocating P-type ATPase [Candidatus Gottesmanbacteria bacterium RBG_16_52_11]|uniref:Magnesium-transporting ATPase, P-type 1 n=1 Tax=Candidatus Gottesmanbacteria bacterium RBG_16_52_11 TaxID=1798374 RepID=A0A1F5YMQ2_9BACT|nr:MAG: magnesium-translocating P-type ATPase [Candidatus Gottesmanbacteria bacterium RBG_16_52_11]